MKSSFVLGLSIFLVTFKVSAAPVTCEKNPQAPEWVVRSAQEMDAKVQAFAPPQEGIHKTFPAIINGLELVVHYVNYPASKKPSKGTVISLCGGPGAPCNGHGKPKNIPDDYDVLMMDYLGIGENKKFNSPEQMSIDSQGSAVMQMVNYSKAKNVLLAGHSFGTSVATVAASKLTATKSPELKGVFLEGTTGKGDYKKYDSSFVRAANTAWGLLSEAEKQEFKRSYSEVTKKLSAQEVQGLDKMISMSVVGGSAEAVKTLKAIRSNMNMNLLKEQLKNKNIRTELLFAGDAVQQIRAAGCQIFSAAQESADQKIFGGLVTAVNPVRKGTCDCKTLSKIWDPAEYPIKGVPVLYVNGQQDPNTAIEWAQSHYDGQTQVADKVMISPKLGGHTETYNGVLSNCVDLFFESLEAQDLSRIKSNKSSMEKSGCSQSGGGTSSKSSQGIR